MDLITTGTVALVGQKLLGKTFDIVGDDLSRLYVSGRNKIIEKAIKKIKDENDGRTTNLRVTRDVFLSGSFTDEAICAEYFGGILASSRSDDGKEDTGVYYVDIIKSLSSNQLKLHYLIYASFNKFFVVDPSKAKLNPGQQTDLSVENIFLSSVELTKIISGDDLLRDLHAIHAKGLAGDFWAQIHPLKNGGTLPYLKVSAKPLGIQLYAVAHNRLSEWRNFTKIDFGNFDSLNPPKFYGQDVNKLLESAGIRDEE